MTQQREGSLLSGIQAVRLFWSVHRQRSRASRLTQLSRSQTPSSERSTSQDPSQDESADYDDHTFCRICRLSDDQLLENVCECKGTMGHIHERCLRMWTIYKRSQMCEICHSKFKWNFEQKLNNRQLVLYFFRRKYFWVLLRDFLNFMVLFGISVLQNAMILTMVQDDQQEGFNIRLPLAIVGASFYDLYFSRWVMNRSLKAYDLVREYWILAHDEEFVGYFDEEYAVFGENQAEIESMLLAEYEAPD
ncbi:uncharacterized protein LOC135702658 [Ochlerotatus camptorhynchus]|uniref:uncharacterized protein LOC135702658 n=1 Tax=Ochlerotatus camptorhynchus TaxID=644619 RepID=UPI0031DF4C12